MPFPSVWLGAGQPVSAWQEMAQDCGGSGGDRSGSSAGSALLWPMPLSLPSPLPAFCSRWVPQSLPVAVELGPQELPCLSLCPPQAYMSCSSDQERLALLADLPVKTGGVGRPRRVGPDLSRRICLFLTATNPELLLDLSS